MFFHGFCSAAGLGYKGSPIWMFGPGKGFCGMSGRLFKMKAPYSCTILGFYIPRLGYDCETIAPPAPDSPLYRLYISDEGPF